MSEYIEGKEIGYVGGSVLTGVVTFDKENNLYKLGFEMEGLKFKVASDDPLLPKEYEEGKRFFDWCCDTDFVCTQQLYVKSRTEEYWFLRPKSITTDLIFGDPKARATRRDNGAIEAAKKATAVRASARRKK